MGKKQLSIFFIVFTLIISTSEKTYSQDSDCDCEGSLSAPQTPITVEEAYLQCLNKLQDTKVCKAEQWSINNCLSSGESLQEALANCRIGDFTNKRTSLREIRLLKIPNIKNHILETIFNNPTKTSELLEKVLDASVTHVSDNSYQSDKTIQAMGQSARVKNDISIDKNPDGTYSITSDHYTSLFVFSKIKLRVGSNGTLSIITDSYFKQSAINKLETLNFLANMGNKIISSKLEKSISTLERELNNEINP